MALTVLLVAGCSAAPDAGDSSAPPPSSPTTSDDRPAVAIEGRDLVLLTGQERRAVASIDDGELVHAELRPAASPDGTTTVLALARTDGRYELRYLNVDADGVASDLYWFPFRMQVDPDTAGTADVPTLPVWAPDGSAVAWLEWGADGTRLRTVGWLDHHCGDQPLRRPRHVRVGRGPGGFPARGLGGRRRRHARARHVAVRTSSGGASASRMAAAIVALDALH